MLVLSRSKGEQIVIGGSITLTVLEVRGDKVKLGFAGPAEVPIHRQEVFERLQQERLAESHRTECESCLTASPRA